MLDKIILFTKRHAVNMKEFTLLTITIFINTFDTSFEIYRTSCRRDALFKLSARNSKLEVTPSSMTRVENLSLCARMCIQENTCKSINYNVFNKSCEILSKNKEEVGVNILKHADNWKYYEPVIYEDSPRCRPNAGVEPCTATQACDEVCSNPVGYQCRNLGNIAAGKSASQSSTTNYGSASRAVDGNRATNYPSSSCTHTKAAKGWWRVDFGNTARVHSVKITNRGDCCGSRLRNFNIRIGDSSSGNGDSNKACALNKNVGGGATTTFKCRPRLLGRYLYVQQNVVDFLTLCEVQVFGEFV